MTMESTMAKGAADAVSKMAQITEASIRKAWSIMDAASEKKMPSEYLSQKAIRAIQGVGEGGG